MTKNPIDTEQNENQSDVHLAGHLLHCCIYHDSCLCQKITWLELYFFTIYVNDGAQPLLNIRTSGSFHTLVAAGFLSNLCSLYDSVVFVTCEYYSVSNLWSHVCVFGCVHYSYTVRILRTGFGPGASRSWQPWRWLLSFKGLVSRRFDELR